MKIKNVKVHLRKLIKNKKGNILKYISKKDVFIKQFGEVYFSYINKNKTKGWNLHKKNKCFIICLFGQVLVHLIDQRKLSKSFNQEMKINLNSSKGKILEIPSKVYFSLNSKKKIVLFAIFEFPHSKRETIKASKVKQYLIPN